MTYTNTVPAAALLACVLLLAPCCGPARADGPAPSAEDRARDLADEVLCRADGDGTDALGEWTRSIVERALQRAGASQIADAPAVDEDRDRSPALLPAERHAGATAAGLFGRANTGEVLVFLSLSVPAASWRQWAYEAALMGVPLLLRGVAQDGFRATVMEIGERLDGHEAGVAIDPRLFRLFGIVRVPSVVTVPGGAPQCTSRGCTDETAPPHDLLTGNIGLTAALGAIAAEGDAGRETARRYLQLLRGEER